MNKSTTILLLVIEILLIFVFANLSSLFHTMQERETRSYIEVAESVADVIMKSAAPETDPLETQNSFFSNIQRVQAAGREAVYDAESGTLQLLRPQADGSAVLFVRHARTPVLETLQRVSRLFSLLIIMTAFFLLITVFYLVYRFRADRGKEQNAPIDPISNYLSRLESSETSLRSTLEEQQQAVSRQQELNRGIIRHINAAILLLNGQGKVAVFNPRAEQLFERSAASALHHPVETVLSCVPEIAAFVREVKVPESSAVVVTRDRDFRVDISSVSEGGRLLVIKEVTRERRRAEIQRRHAGFAMLGEMAAYLTHEMRNSLGVVYGYTRSLKADKERVERINHEITYLTGMMDNFLNFARPLSPGERTPVNLTEILAAECEAAGLELAAPEKGVEVRGDAGLVRSLCSNLARNAAEAGADRMELVIDGTDPLELRLHDNGRGIPEDQRDKIWLPFFTTKEEGTGMGLALVRKIMNALDGDIRLEDSLEKGTEFRLTFFS
ncbi:MAG TPA: hypothetical protein ENN40_05905 [Candidatus Aminicenantes bacterium]|nr:hypothetical protein [Candidatus Aminicenantes bacterium]